MSSANTALFNTGTFSYKAATVSSLPADQTPGPIVPALNVCVYTPDCSSSGHVDTLDPLHLHLPLLWLWVMIKVQIQS